MKTIGQIAVALMLARDVAVREGRKEDAACIGNAINALLTLDGLPARSVSGTWLGLGPARLS